MLKNYSFVFTHVKGTDNLGHDGDAKGKAEFIEKIDKELSRFLPENYKDKLVIAVCGDHSTPCSFKDHSADPVPVMITSSDCLKDEVQSFGERACYKGGLGRILGKNLMGILLNELRLVEKFGA
ncbi:2,3-bisphosphoglycerate-independent phosphoglycerate mutase [subsurface metagenome]